jgi:sulfur carrier protein
MTHSPAGHGVTTVNGEPNMTIDGATVADLVDVMCRSPRGVAVAVDGIVVPRSTWEMTTIAPGATVEIVTAAAGG